VAIEDNDSAVDAVMVIHVAIINHEPSKPAFPTNHPCRRYMMTPRMVTIVGVNTPENVPNPLLFFCIDVYIFVDVDWTGGKVYIVTVAVIP
jgi:hypothetical protein